MVGDRLRVVMGTVYPYDEATIHGGVEAVAFYLTNALTRRSDIELLIVSCNRTVKRDCVEQRGPVTFHWLKTSPRLYGLRAATIDAWRVKRLYQQIRPDIIHVQGISEYAVAAGLEARMVLAIHGIEPFVASMQETIHFQGLPGTYRRWIANRLTKRSIDNACAVISNSGEYVPTALHHWLVNKPVHYVANPVDDEFFLPGQNNEVDDGPILWAGQISERKNIVGLLQAFAIVRSCLPEARLQLVGGVSEPFYYQRVNETLDSLSLIGKVEIVGSVEQRKVARSFHEASLVVNFSFEETAPMVVAQAMATGKPVVATRVGGIPWMVEEGVTGYLVAPGDIQGLANRVIELCQDKSKRERMGQAARQKARQRFAADMVANSMVQIYREMVERIS